MREYINVNLRKDYIDAVDQAIAENPFITSRAEYVRRAIELKLREDR